MDQVILRPADAMLRRSLPKVDANAADAKLRKAAQNFETVFLAEMLTSMGLDREPEAFGGGFGAEAFSSLLNEAYAEHIVRRGGIGIADAIYRQLHGRTTP